jgi:AcrR family transcriptional regulator
MERARLSKAAWVEAAFDVLMATGPDAVAVQPLARRLGTTKGSFYWHFHTRDELLDAALVMWEEQVTDSMIARLEAAGGPAADQVQQLFAAVTTSARPGELRLLNAAGQQAAGQQAGRQSPGQQAVAAAVERVTLRRIAYVARLLRATGLGAAAAERRARLAYAAYLGYVQLTQSVPAALPRTPRARRALVAEMTAALVGDTSP